MYRKTNADSRGWKKLSGSTKNEEAAGVKAVKKSNLLWTMVVDDE